MLAKSAAFDFDAACIEPDCFADAVTASFVLGPDRPLAPAEEEPLLIELPYLSVPGLVVPRGLDSVGQAVSDAVLGLGADHGQMIAGMRQCSHSTLSAGWTEKRDGAGAGRCPGFS
jgi:hypothetical protein